MVILFDQFVKVVFKGLTCRSFLNHTRSSSGV